MMGVDCGLCCPVDERINKSTHLLSSFCVCVLGLFVISFAETVWGDQQGLLYCCVPGFLKLKNTKMVSISEFVFLENRDNCKGVVVGGMA